MCCHRSGETASSRQQLGGALVGARAFAEPQLLVDGAADQRMHEAQRTLGGKNPAAVSASAALAAAPSCPAARAACRNAAPSPSTATA